MSKDNSMSTIPFEEIKKDLKIKTIRGRKYFYLYFRVQAQNGTTIEKRRKDFYVGPVDVSEEILKQNICFALRKIFQDTFEFIDRLYFKYFEYDHLTDKQIRELNLLSFAYNILLNKFSRSDLERYEEAAYTKYVYGTTSIEGNTYTLRETDLTLNEGLTVGGKEKREFYEIENYGKLQKHLLKMNKINIDIDFIKKLHSIIMQNIDDESSGIFRRIDVGIRGSEHVPVPAIFVEEEMKELMKWYEDRREKVHPVELACLFHQKFEEIHPFKDGNGRVGREVLRLMLKEGGLPTIFIDKKNREKYLKGLDEGNNGNHKMLLDFLVGNLIDTHDDMFRKGVACFEEDFKEFRERCNDCHHLKVCRNIELS